jgi:hypothetical protein
MRDIAQVENGNAKTGWASQVTIDAAWTGALLRRRFCCYSYFGGVISDNIR